MIQFDEDCEFEEYPIGVLSEIPDQSCQDCGHPYIDCMCFEWFT